MGKPTAAVFDFNAIAAYRRSIMETLAVLTLQVVVVAVLATLGVGDLYRQRQLTRYRVVIYPRRPRRAS